MEILLQHKNTIIGTIIGFIFIVFAFGMYGGYKMKIDRLKVQVNEIEKVKDIVGKIIKTKKEIEKTKEVFFGGDEFDLKRMIQNKAKEHGIYFYSYYPQKAMLVENDKYYKIQATLTVSAHFFDMIEFLKSLEKETVMEVQSFQNSGQGESKNQNKFVVNIKVLSKIKK